jgi:hypothetical protein
MNDWKLLKVVTDGEPLVLEGENVWAFEWDDIELDSFEVPHPSYPNQRHRLKPYSITVGKKTIAFAAGELSNSVWCFYVPA